MTPTLGDYVGCAIALSGLVPLARAYLYADMQGPRPVVGQLAASIACFVIGAAVVILM